ncbi:related to tRNA dihydrouridine synthase [Phialocephala subalpina]|uniref:tRNA-dihydrouridine(16/17) synthase [NAD(P)(+)] n=1 Tax=Phialocephala subalpina TaxID=576137 RepID=A0A1L7WP92_9HELO|nr:related to tRNA dihydrouridine synthase [Phialocephala subalpina]
MTINDRAASTATSTVSSSANMNGNGVQASSADGRKKLHGRSFYESIGSPKFVLAPMVDQSEFAWRMLTRSFMPSSSPQDLLAYTPMLHARMFSETPKFRDTHFQPLRSSLTTPPPIPHTSPSSDIFLDGNPKIDRPLFVQFCANDPEELLKAAKYVQPFCDAVDLNLGCPQGIARKGKYGAFLQEDQQLVFNLINKLHRELEVPVTAKIRILETKEKTLEYAQNVLKAGASILTVHGRTREMKGHKTGLADWKVIKWLRENLPRETVMFANGNILRKEDITRCLEETGVDGVMSAEGNLYDPAIFAEDPEVGDEGREFWRGKDGKGGWRMDAVFRRYMDIMYKFVLETPAPTRTPLYLPSDPEPEPQPAVTTSNGVEKEKEGGKRERGGEAEGPPKKRQKSSKPQKSTSPNLLAMQPHLFHLLRPLVAKHHNVRDALARCRAGDIAAFENVLKLTESAVKSGLEEYEATNGRSWERDMEEDERLKAAKVKEEERMGNGNGGKDGDGDGEMDESSVETVRACKRPWWVVQPYVRPLPKEALAKGSLTLSRKEKAALEAADVAESKKVEQAGPNGHVEVERVGDEKGKKEVEIPKEGLVCG